MFCVSGKSTSRQSQRCFDSSAQAILSSVTAQVFAPQRPSRRANSEASISAAATISTAASFKFGATNSFSASSAGAGRIGTVKLKVAPPPGALSTAMWPSMRSTMRREMASPKPVPPNLRVDDPSVCSKSRKMRA